MLIQRTLKLKIFYNFCALIIVFFSNTFAQGRVIGRIVDDDGKPIAGATVSVSGQTAMVAITNAQGYYVLLDVPQGSYEVKATKRGLPSWKSNISISSGSTQRVDVKLVENIENVVVAKQSEESRKTRAEKPKSFVTKSKSQPKVDETASSDSLTLQLATNPANQDHSKEAELQKAISESEKLNQLDESLDNLPEKDVEIVGGIEAVQSKIEYPLAIKRAKIGGTVVARVFIDESGNLVRVKLLQPANKFLNEEVIRVLTEETKFLPAKVGDSPIAGAITIPVKFQIR